MEENDASPSIREGRSSLADVQDGSLKRLLGLSVAVVALGAGDLGALQPIVQALENPEITLSERKSFTLAIARFFGDGDGDIPNEHILVARKLDTSRVLTEQLQTLRATSRGRAVTPLGASDRVAQGTQEATMRKRERFVFNATLSTMANLAFGGMTAELHAAGALELMLDALLSPNESTLNYAAACVQNMTNVDKKCIAFVQASDAAMQRLTELIEAEGHDEETMINISGALMNVSRAALRKKGGGFFATLMSRAADSDGDTDPILQRLRKARQRKQLILERRSMAKLSEYVLVIQARLFAKTLRATRAEEVGALKVIARYARKWRVWHLEYCTAVRKISPPFEELPTVWQLAGGVAEGVAAPSSAEELAESRLRISAIQGSLHVLQGSDLADVCTWLRLADGCTVLAQLMLAEDVAVHEAATHVVANLVSSETDTPDGVRASRELLLRRRALHALAVRIAPLAGPGGGVLPGAPQAAGPGPTEEGRASAEQACLYALAALHNLSTADNFGADAVRTSVIESQLFAVALLNLEGRAGLGREEAAEPARAALVSVCARLALDTLCNLEEWALLPTPTAADLGLGADDYAAVRALVQAQFAEQLLVRLRSERAVKVVQRVTRAYREARTAKRRTRAATRIQAVQRGSRLRGTGSLYAQLRERRRGRASAAVRIQSHARGRHARQRLVPQVRAQRAIEAEHAHRVALVTAARRRGKRLALGRGSAAEAAQQRARFLEMRASAVRLQAAARGRAARRRLPAQRELHAARQAQRERELRELQEAAATRLQRVARGHAMRRRFDPEAQRAALLEGRALRARQATAATAINRRARTHFTRLRFQRHRSWQREQAQRTRRSRAAALIGRSWRRYAGVPHERAQLRRQLALHGGAGQVAGSYQQLLRRLEQSEALRSQLQEVELRKRQADRKRAIAQREHTAAQLALQLSPPPAWAQRWAQLPPPEQMQTRDAAAMRVQARARGMGGRNAAGATRRTRRRQQEARAAREAALTAVAVAASAQLTAAEAKRLAERAERQAQAKSASADAALAAARAATAAERSDSDSDEEAEAQAEAEAEAERAERAQVAQVAKAAAAALLSAASTAPPTAGRARLSERSPTKSSARRHSPGLPPVGGPERLGVSSSIFAPQQSWASPVRVRNSPSPSYACSPAQTLSASASRSRANWSAAPRELEEWPSTIDGGGLRPMALPELRRAAAVLDAREMQLAAMRARVHKLGKEVEQGLTAASSSTKELAAERQALLERKRRSDEHTLAQLSIFSPDGGRTRAFRSSPSRPRTLVPVSQQPRALTHPEADDADLLESPRGTRGRGEQPEELPPWMRDSPMHSRSPAPTRNSALPALYRGNVESPH